jgi:polar amino acid transport system substrate-binding protein
MLRSVALMTFFSANVVSRLTADRVENVIRSDGDLRGKKLAAVALSSGAEFLDGLRLKHKTYANLQDALEALARGESDVVVNSEGALRYLVSERFSNVIRVPRVQLAPAYMGVALPEGSALKKPIDRALIKITESAEWRSIEERYFGK